MPAAVTSTPMRPVVEPEWMAMNASIYLLSSPQAERITVQRRPISGYRSFWGESLANHSIT